MVAHRMHGALARWRLQERVAGLQQQLWDAVQRLGSSTPCSATAVSLVSHPDGGGPLHQSGNSMPLLTPSPRSRDSGSDAYPHLTVDTAPGSAEATRLAAEQARKLQLQTLEITEVGSSTGGRCWLLYRRAVATVLPPPCSPNPSRVRYLLHPSLAHRHSHTQLQERVSHLSQSVQAVSKQLAHQRLLASRLLWKHLRASRFKNVPPMDRHLVRMS